MFENLLWKNATTTTTNRGGDLVDHVGAHAIADLVRIAEHNVEELVAIFVVFVLRQTRVERITRANALLLSLLLFIIIHN